MIYLGLADRQLHGVSEVTVEKLLPKIIRLTNELQSYPQSLIIEMGYPSPLDPLSNPT